jgi:hypothetical protein
LKLRIKRLLRKGLTYGFNPISPKALRRKLRKQRAIPTGQSDVATCDVLRPTEISIISLQLKEVRVLLP